MRAFVRARAMHRGAVVAGGAAAGLLLLAVPALAHITVTPGSAAAGSAVVLTFHVPDEEAGAATIKLDMRIPTAHPIAQLLVKPVPGWRIAVRTVTLAKPVPAARGGRPAGVQGGPDLFRRARGPLDRRAAAGPAGA